MEEVSSHVNSNGWGAPLYGVSNLQDHSGPSRFVAAEIDTPAWYNLAAADLGRWAEEDDYEACAERVRSQVRQDLEDFIWREVPRVMFLTSFGGMIATGIRAAITTPNPHAVILNAGAGFVGGAATGVMTLTTVLLTDKRFDTDALIKQSCGSAPRGRRNSP